MSGLKKFMVGCFLPIVLLGIGTFTGCSMYFNNFWKNAIPKEIGVGQTIERETDWLGSPGGNCGGAVFKLKKESKVKILENGISYFADKSTPRNLTTSSITWSQEDTDGRLDVSFHCVTKRHRTLVVRNSVREGRAYYGIMDGTAFNTRLLIVPEEDLIFIGYWD